MERGSAKYARELLREWDFHNRKHHCYYEESNDSGIDECPTRTYPNLGAFVEGRGFPVENSDSRIFGRDLAEPNFWSRIPVTENPVSIAELRRQGKMRVNRGIHYRESTDEVLNSRAQRATEGPSENEQHPWEVEAMDYFKVRLDEIENSVRNGQSYIEDEIQRVNIRIDALVGLVSSVEDKIDERSESAVSVNPAVNITLSGVPADVAETLQEELVKRVERLMAKRARESGR